MERKIIVSGCLLGFECAFDGFSRKNKRVIEFCSDSVVIAVCPEISGGLSCPRERCEIAGGGGDEVLSGQARVLSLSGEDVTAAFIKGAQTVLNTAINHSCRLAILKDQSPSCASKSIHAGNFDNAVIPGRGVTSALLGTSGIKVISDIEI